MWLFIGLEMKLAVEKIIKKHKGRKEALGQEKKK